MRTATLQSGSAPALGIAELFGAAQQLAAAGRAGDAAALYRDWLARSPADPLRHAVLFNQGVVLAGLGDQAGAVAAFQEAIRLAPGFLPPYINLGAIFEKVGAVEPALAHWTHVANTLGAVNGESVGYKVAALKLMGQLLESRKLHAEAEDALRRVIELAPQSRDVVQHWISLRQRQCTWPLLQPVGGLDRAALLRTMAPLSLANYADDPMLQLANAWSYSRQDVGWAKPAAPAPRAVPPPRPAGQRLRIGYLSSDLREHAIGYLTADMFRLHDREAFEVFVYYCGIPQEDATKARIRESVEHWTSITELDDDAALARILEDGIDILVDVNGHTRSARTKLLARRPAPVIVNWLGYAGTMGSPYHHYIIADPVIVPPGSEIYYSEQVLRLPCYQPNDRNRPMAARTPTRAEAGLPEDKVVFCSFNGTQKITPFVFARWMEILRRVPDSVLWLLKSSDQVDVRLRELADLDGVAPERLVFAPLMGNLDHVARYACADLFLDTTPYGAHTTASDALWMGVPVLTLPGRSFASRVSSSLVSAAGLPELVCHSPEEYVRRAVALGHDRAQLAAWRAQLLAARGTSLLFDTPRFVREIEALYRAMHQDRVEGRLPRPNLLNLDTYLELGAERDHDSAEHAYAPGYEESWRAALAARHAYAPLPPDGRFWEG